MLFSQEGQTSIHLYTSSKNSITIAGPISLNYIAVGKLTHSCFVDLIKVTLAGVDTDLAKEDDGNKVFTAVYSFLYFFPLHFEHDH